MCVFRRYDSSHVLIGQSACRLLAFAREAIDTAPAGASDSLHVGCYISFIVPVIVYQLLTGMYGKLKLDIRLKQRKGLADEKLHLLTKSSEPVFGNSLTGSTAFYSGIRQVSIYVYY